MSVHDEVDLAEVELRHALERELAHVLPPPDVAAAVIGRYRRDRRRKRASLAAAVAGLGVPLTIVPLVLTGSGGAGGSAGSTGPADAVLRIAAYTLRLPASYRPQTCGSPASAAGVSAAGVSAASSAGGCLVLALTPAVRPGRETTAGRFRVRVVPHGLVVAPPVPGRPALSVTSTSLPVAELESMVATGLRYAA